MEIHEQYQVNVENGYQGLRFLVVGGIYGKTHQQPKFSPVIDVSSIPSGMEEDCRIKAILKNQTTKGEKLKFFPSITKLRDYMEREFGGHERLPNEPRGIQ